VTGLDVNPAMIEVAQRIPTPPGAGRITYVVASADKIPFPDGSFDLVTCQQMLHFARDRMAVLRQMRRVLAPGGRAAISVWADITQHPAQRPLHDAIVRHAGPPGLIPGMAFSIAAELEQMLAGAGFASATAELVTMDARFPEPVQVAHRRLLAATAGIRSFRHSTFRPAMP
jgi:ubiquinone/menaquinone biosynthesis C-methylase UbiE